MRLLRWLTVAAALIIAVIYGSDKIITYMNSDSTVPVITSDTDILEISINADSDTLKTGLSAYDEKDGDLTSEIIVEQVSNFIEKGVCSVTYAVVDSDSHVVKYTREIRYTDYTSPEFYLNEPLCYYAGDAVRYSGIIGAYDVIDGDISGKIKLISHSVQVNTPGTYSMTFSITNSKGDSASITLPVEIKERIFSSSPLIKLSEYLITVEVGATVDYKQYYIGVCEQNGEEIENVTELYSSVYFKSHANTRIPGVYTVEFYMNDKDGDKLSSTSLCVVVQ